MRHAHILLWHRTPVPAGLAEQDAPHSGQQSWRTAGEQMNIYHRYFSLVQAPMVPKRYAAAATVEILQVPSLIALPCYKHSNCTQLVAGMHCMSLLPTRTVCQPEPYGTHCVQSFRCGALYSSPSRLRHWPGQPLLPHSEATSRCFSARTCIPATLAAYTHKLCWRNRIL